MPDAGIELGAVCMPSELASDRVPRPVSEQVYRNKTDFHRHFSRTCGVSEQVGIRPVFIDTFLGSAVSGSEQVSIRPELNGMC